MVLGCAGMAGGSRISRKRRFRSRRPAGVQRPSGQLPWFSAGMAPIETNPRASGRLSTTADRVVTLEWAGMGCGGCILPAIVRSATRPDRCIPRSAAVRGSWARRDANNKAQRWPNDICGGRAFSVLVPVDIVGKAASILLAFEVQSHEMCRSKATYKVEVGYVAGIRFGQIGVVLLS